MLLGDLSAAAQINIPTQSTRLKTAADRPGSTSQLGSSFPRIEGVGSRVIRAVARMGGPGPRLIRTMSAAGYVGGSQNPNDLEAEHPTSLYPLDISSKGDRFQYLYARWRRRSFSQSSGSLQGGRPLGEQAPPYGSLIRELLDRDQLAAARQLLMTALPTQGDDPQLRALQVVLAVPTMQTSTRTDPDRSREYRWLARNAASHRHHWVAVEGEELVATGATLAELRAQLRDLTPPRKPLIHHID
jgi:hypothetical protein